MTVEPRRFRLPAAPEEGWASVILVGFMALMMALAIDDTAWVIGDSDLTDFLWIATLGGALAGFLGAKVGWNRWVAHALGASFAAVLMPLLVGQVLAETLGLGSTSLGWQFHATADQAARAWDDLVVLKLQQTRAIGHYLLVLGLLCWGTAQFAASAVFRHHRPLSAVVVMGAVLVANMAATLHEQIFYLILFSIAALLLLARLHALDEQATWARRRIGDPATVGSIYLRGGAAFIAAAVLGAFVLTATATSKPLEGAWEDLKPWLLDVSSAIQRFLPTLEDSRGIGGVRFGSSATISGNWTTDSGLAMTVERTPGDDTHYYWRVITFDRYVDTGWEWGDPPGTNKLPVPAGEELLEESFDRVLTPGTKDVSFRITPFDLAGSYVASPLTPLTIDRDAALEGTTDGAFFQAVEVSGRNPYVITARVPLLGDEDGGQTQNKLRVAGRAYPEEIKDRYLQTTPTAVGPEARQILDDVLLKLKQDGLSENPYDLAAGIARELSSRRFEYDPSVLDIHAQCGDLSTSECFATFKKGYCQHYATLMTVLLRARGVPARFVEGFLPGDLNERTGVEQVLNSGAHAWTEVYFPGTGWVAFDSTPSSVNASEPLPSGRPQSAPPSLIPSLLPFPRDDELPSRSPGSLVPPGGRDGGIGPGGIALIGFVLVLTLVLLVAFLLWRRGPRGIMSPDGAWTGIGRLAGRFGYGPRPTQTTYEYATALADVLPGIGPELQTVATAKVEVAYGGRVLGDDRLRAIRDAYAKLRVRLLRLFFRRPRRPRRLR
jgi:transglutaminase-like putative cysteine protease